MLYGKDLSYVHHVGFGAFAEQSAQGLVGYLRSAGIESGLIVDLACGGGIWAEHALRAGYAVFGVDASPAMIEIARRVAPGAVFVVGSVHSVAIPSCVAVTAVGEGISYLPPGRDDLEVEELVHRVYDALAPGGLFIFDAVERCWTAPMSYETSRVGSDWTVDVEVREDPKRHLLTRTIRIRREVGAETRHSIETHRLRTFDRHELEAMLAAARFSVEVTRSYGAVELSPQRIGIIARKGGHVHAHG